MNPPIQPTQFTRESAERIASVVRSAELEPTATRALSFDRVDVLQKAKLFRVGTFNGSWPVGTDQTVTFINKTSTPNTVSATNLFFPIDSPPADCQCAIAKDGTSWYLIDVPLEESSGILVEQLEPKHVVAAGSTSRISFIGTGSTTRITFYGLGSTQAISYISSIETASVSVLSSVSASINPDNCQITVTPQTVTAVASVSAVTETASILLSSSTQTAISVSMSGTQTATVVNLANTQTLITVSSWRQERFLKIKQAF